MKIRCGSHQQNRSIVRPGLSLMATKVALTAEEFRENSQRSIDLFNTEKLSTDSTRVLKSVYCNSVHFCRCNLRGACGGKGRGLCRHGDLQALQSARSVWRQSYMFLLLLPLPAMLQSARSVWRQSAKSRKWSAPKLSLQSARSVWRQRIHTSVPALTTSCCNLRGACGGKECSSQILLKNPLRCNLRGACGGKVVSVGSRDSA